MKFFKIKGSKSNQQRVTDDCGGELGIVSTAWSFLGGDCWTHSLTESGFPTKAEAVTDLARCVNAARRTS